MAWLAALAVGALAQVALAADGHALASTGTVTLERPQAAPAAVRAGTEVERGDLIRTGSDGRVQIRFTDGSIVSLQPGTAFRIDEYRFDEGGQRGFFHLLRGALRTMTGAIGKRDHDDYRMQTPTATVGVRGTEYVAEQTVCDPRCAPGPRAGLRVAVTSGRIVVTTRGGAVEVGEGESAIAEDPDAAPRMTDQGPTLPPISYRTGTVRPDTALVTDKAEPDRLGVPSIAGDAGLPRQGGTLPGIGTPATMPTAAAAVAQAAATPSAGTDRRDTETVVAGVTLSVGAAAGSAPAANAAGAAATDDAAAGAADTGGVAGTGATSTGGGAAAAGTAGGASPVPSAGMPDASSGGAADSAAGDGSTVGDQVVTKADDEPDPAPDAPASAESDASAPVVIGEGPAATDPEPFVPVDESVSPNQSRDDSGGLAAVSPLIPPPPAAEPTPTEPTPTEPTPTEPTPTEPTLIPLSPGISEIGKHRRLLAPALPIRGDGGLLASGASLELDDSLGLRSFGNCPGTRCLTLGSARIAESGADLYTSWGRWTDGTVQLRTPSSATELHLSANQGVHYLIGVPSVTVPTSGQFAYDLVGSTRPTLSDGSVAAGLFSGRAGVLFGPAQPARIGLEGTVSIGGGAYSFATRGGAVDPASSTLGTSDGYRFRGDLPVAGSADALPCGTGGCRVDLQGGLFGPDGARLGLSYEIRSPEGGSTTISGVSVFQKR